MPNLYDVVCASFVRHGVPVDGVHVVLHKGLFSETLPKLPDLTIAFAHVDCDWYEPVAQCLAYLADRLAPGGAIMLDDFHTYGGSRSATLAFLAARRDYVLEDGENVILWRRPPA